MERPFYKGETMSQTKQIALDHLNRINAGDIAGAAALMAETCLNHAAIPEAQGRAGFVAVMGKLRTAFPDMRYTVEDVIVEGDRAVMRVTAAGTQTGPVAFTRLPLEATGKPVKFEQIHIVRVTDGKIVEHWLGQDSLALFRQLGLKITQA
jgi:predicted ester cyclase